MHTDSSLVHAVADFRREALLAEFAAKERSEPHRRPAARCPGFLRALFRSVSATFSWLIVEFEARPFVPHVPDAVGSMPRSNFRQ